MIKKTVKDDFLPCVVHLCVGKNYREALSYYIKKTKANVTDYYTPLPGMHACLVWDRDTCPGEYLMWLETKDLVLLAHEINHLVFRQFEISGIEISQLMHEVYAYYYDLWFYKLATAMGAKL